MLTNILLDRLTKFGPITLALPTSESAQRQIARSGLLFALSRHPGLAVHGGDLHTQTHLSKWSRDWAPTDFDQTLFSIPGENDADDPQDLDTDLVAFLNPNWSPADSSSDDVDSVIYPWLRKLLSKARITDVTLRSQVLRDMSFATSELLNNVRDHARIGYHGNCALTLFATGSSVSDSRIYLSVVDDGVGMATTLQERATQSLPDRELVEAAFSGNLPRRHRGRGEGLSIVRAIADRYNGSLFAATGPSVEGAIVYEHESTEKSGCEYVEGLTVHGTVIVLCLPTAQIAADTES
ncbi:ATP-binding protein [Mycobacterium sp. UM_WGJ]|uniref:ATP-binding protein n=1 Tax=Mycobacterium sp. UM_WGJ TaxID=1370120 RepID=UPI0018CA4C6A|nr:ATP-binding protein [Mycobacterium sp. UM_WGJ]